MDIIGIVNTLQPNTISRLALKAGDFPNNEPSIPFMGAFVHLFPGAILPSPSDVIAYQPTYDAMIAQQKADAAAKSSLPDDSTIIAHLVAFAVNGTPIPDTAIEAVNVKLSSIDQPVIETGAVSLRPKLNNA